MPPEDDTLPTPHSGPQSTDPIFPPPLGRQGQKPVSVTAVQGPGVVPPPKAKEITTTDRLLSGLLDSPTEATHKSEKKRKRESSGEEAAAYNLSPRPVPVAHEEGEMRELVVAPMAEKAEGGEGTKGIRDDRTVSLPRNNERIRAIAAFVAALVIVLGIGWLVLRKDAPEATVPPRPTPTLRIPPITPILAPKANAEALPPAQAEPAPNDTSVSADPVIESQILKRPAPRAPTAPRPSASAAASATPPAATAGSNGLPPDFDELKKGIKH